MNSVVTLGADCFEIFKEKIDEKYDEDGGRQNVCIWKDKDAEKEFYRLTNKFRPVNKAIIMYGEYMDFEIVKLPKTTSIYITVDWKVSDELKTTCTLNRAALMKDTVDRLAKANPTFKVSNYVTNFEPSIYINDVQYKITSVPHYNSGTLRGELSGCVAEEKRLIAEIEKYFAIEIGKKANKSIVNMTTMLADVKAIESKMLYAKPKIAGKNYYDGGMTLILS